MQTNKQVNEEARWDVIFGVKNSLIAERLSAIKVTSPFKGRSNSAFDYSFSLDLGSWLIAGGDVNMVWFDLPVTDYFIDGQPIYSGNPADKDSRGAYGYFRIELNLQDLMEGKISRIEMVQTIGLDRVPLRIQSDLAYELQENGHVDPAEFKAMLIDVSTEMRKDTGVLEWLKDPVFKYLYVKDIQKKAGDYLLIAMNRKNRPQPANIVFPFEQCSVSNNFIFKISKHVLVEHYLLGQLCDATKIVRKMWPDRFFPPTFEFITDNPHLLPSKRVNNVLREEGIPDCFNFDKSSLHVSNQFIIALEKDETDIQGGTVLYSEIREQDYQLSINDGSLWFDITAHTPIKFYAGASRERTGLSVAHYTRVYTYKGQRDLSGNIQIALDCISRHDSHEWYQGFDPVEWAEKEILELLNIVLETPLSFLLNFEIYLLLTLIDAILTIDIMLSDKYFDAVPLEDKIFKIFNIENLSDIRVQNVEMHDGLVITGIISK